MNLQSNQPTTAPLGRSQSERGRGAESRDARLDKERQEREQLKAEGVVVDTHPESVLRRAAATENAKGLGEGLKTKSFTKSPNPNPLHLEVFSILKGGIDSLPQNDFGRPWPDPRRGILRSLVAGKPQELCLKAAWEAREIVQSQDRAPNITNLFSHKLALLVETRETVRRELGAGR